MESVSYTHLDVYKRQAINEVDEAHETTDFRHDRVVMRVPAGDRLASLDRGAVLDCDGRTIRQLVAFALAAMAVQHRQFAGTRYRDQVAVGVLDKLQVVELDGTSGLDRDVVHGCRTRCRATDVERTDCQLGAGLADRLRGDDADRCTDVDDVADVYKRQCDC